MDLDALWDFARPEVSEQRFRAALASAQGDEALILRTQIARTFSLRDRCDEALCELDALAPLLAAAGPEPNVRARLERGRTLRSAGKPDEARPLFEEAFALADAAGLAGLAADALHMLPLVERELDVQISGHRRLLDYVRASPDPQARAWEASGLNNLGVALNDAGRHEEALVVLRDALTLRERRGVVGPVRIARWMVAHTLRRLGRVDEALAIQRELEHEFAAAGEVDPYVFEELALLHQARGDTNEAERWRARWRAATGH